VSLAQARSALDVIGAGLQRQYPAENEGKRLAIERELRARPDLAVAEVLPRAAAIFITLTTLVLLIACANVASLMLARMSGRRTELAVRTALGAGRMQIVRQLLTESVVIAGIGGAAGVLLALGTAHWLESIRLSTEIPVELDVQLDWRVLAITAGAVLLAAMLSGAGPSLRSLRSSDPQLADALKAGARGTGGVTRQRFRAGLVTAQIAVSFVLLVAAGLFLRSVQRARTLDLGFRQDHAFMATTDVSLARYDSERGKAFYRSLLARAAVLPGVRGAALASTIPLGTSHSDADVYADLPTLANERGHTHIEIVAVTPGYFDVLGIGLLRGRDFTAHDDTAGAVMIINAATAARLWPATDPIGQRVRLTSDGPQVTVIAVAKTVTSGLLGERPHPMLYVPIAQRYRAEMTLHLSTAGDASQLAAPVRELVASLDPNLAPFAVKTMREHLDGGIAFTPIRLAATLATAIGLLGLFQALIGLYGVVAYSVAQRGHEIGIRMAIGATSGNILRGVLREGMLLAAAGLMIGFILSLGVMGVLRSLLVGVSARDPVTFGGLALLLATVTLAACWIPAARAAGVPPAGAMRD
jgi:predicted permease